MKRAVGRIYIVLGLVALSGTSTAEVRTISGSAGGVPYTAEIKEPYLLEHDGPQCATDQAVQIGDVHFYFRDNNPKPEVPEDAIFSVVLDYKPASIPAVFQFDTISTSLDSGEAIEKGNVYDIPDKWNKRGYFHLYTTSNESPRTRQWAVQVITSGCTTRFVIDFTVRPDK